MKNLLRAIIALLLAAMLIPMAISCADTGNPAETTLPAETVAPGSDSSVVEDETTLFAPSDIPDDLKFEGTTIRLLYWEDVPEDEFFVENQTGASVNDAIYKRNANVEEQFGITLDFTGTPGSNKKQTEFVNVCINSTQSGADAYDIFCGYSMTGATIMTQGISQDLTEYEIMEFDKPWWPKSLIDKATLNGGIYFASGDISTNYLYMMYLCYFNKDMFTNIYNASSDVLYDLVYNGEWTVDKLIEYSTGVYSDNNGDTIANEGDRFGFVVTSVHVDPFYTGADLDILETNSDGDLVLSPDLFSTRTVDLLEKLSDFIHTSGDCYTAKGYQVFGADQALFISERALIISRDIPDVAFTYGILPTPKYDKDQQGYRTCLSFGYTMYNLSTAAPNADAAAATLELMAYQSYLHITPALFEESMKVRYSDQSDDAAMYDYVRDGVVIDIGRIFTTQLDKMSYSIFRNALMQNTVGSYASTQKSNEVTLNKKIQAINDTLSKLGS